LGVMSDAVVEPAAVVSALTVTADRLTERLAVSKDELCAAKEQLLGLAGAPLTDMKKKMFEWETDVDNLPASIALLRKALSHAQIASSHGIGWRDLVSQDVTVAEEHMVAQFSAHAGGKSSAIARLEAEHGVCIEDSSRAIGLKLVMRGSRANIDSCCAEIDRLRASYWEEIEGLRLRTVQFLELRGELSRAAASNGVKVTTEGAFVYMEGPPDSVKKCSTLIRFMCSGFYEVSVNPKCVGGLIGKGGANVRDLETSTNTYIDVDRQGFVRIYGDEESVEAAVEEVTAHIATLSEDLFGSCVEEVKVHQSLLADMWPEQERDFRGDLSMMGKKFSVTVEWPVSATSASVRGQRDDACKQGADELASISNFYFPDKCMKVSYPRKEARSFLLGSVDLKSSGLILHELGEGCFVSGRPDQISSFRALVEERIMLWHKHNQQLILDSKWEVEAISDRLALLKVAVPGAKVEVDIAEYAVRIAGPEDVVERLKEEISKLLQDPGAWDCGVQDAVAAQPQAGAKYAATLKKKKAW